jgi:hypothetical protein
MYKSHELLQCLSEISLKFFWMSGLLFTKCVLVSSCSYTELFHHPSFIKHLLYYYYTPFKFGSQSQWPCGLRRESTAARLLGLWVRIPPGAWMSVCGGVPRGGVWGVQTPPAPKFWRPTKIVPNATRLWKLLKIPEFRTPTPQHVWKKGSKILKPPRFAVVLH